VNLEGVFNDLLKLGAFGRCRAQMKRRMVFDLVESFASEFMAEDSSGMQLAPSFLADKRIDKRE
jgi:hypothetical protein